MNTPAQALLAHPVAAPGVRSGTSVVRSLCAV